MARSSVSVGGLLALACAGAILAAGSSKADIPHPLSGPVTQETRYVAFQMFTDKSPLFGGNASTSGPTIASRTDIEAWLADLVRRVGSVGNRRQKLAFFVGPLALDYSDDQLRGLIADAFDLALAYDVAVGFHIDDSMFWGKRAAIANDPRNLEWTTWSGIANTGRRIDWDVTPTKLYPQMCYNSAAVRDELRRVGAEVIGAEIRRGAEALARLHKSELFAGVIVGWETQLGRDFDTDYVLGYCALTNAGLSAASTAAALNDARVAIVRDFVDFWTGALASGGVEPTKLYAHVAFLTHADYDVQDASTPRHRATYVEAANFSPPETAFGPNHRPGFSTYPASDLYPEIYAALGENGNPAWASSEGTNVVPPGFRGEDTMETYLGRMFNHGATIVNLYGWGLGGAAGASNPYRIETEHPDSIAAYRKFLSGAALTESAIPSTYGLAAKIKRIQARLPQWIAAGGNAALVQPLVDKLDRDLSAGDYFAADTDATQILAIIGG